MQSRKRIAFAFSYNPQCTFTTSKKLHTGSCPQVPVIGGHAGVTILPLLSQATPRLALDLEAAAKLTARIQVRSCGIHIPGHP